jgi:hypothetical protein
MTRTYSVTAGTIFHKTRVPLRISFWAIFFGARHKQGISAFQLQRDTGLGSYQTARRTERSVSASGNRA